MDHWLRSVAQTKAQGGADRTYIWHRVMAAIALAIPQLDASLHQEEATENRNR